MFNEFDQKPILCPGFGVLSPPVTPCNNSSILLESCESPGVGRDPLHIAKVVNWTVQRWAPNDHRTLSIERSKGFCTGTNLTNAFELMLNLPRVKLIILLMEDSLCPLIDSFSHCLQGFLHPRWCRISSINSMTWSKSQIILFHPGLLLLDGKFDVQLSNRFQPAQKKSAPKKNAKKPENCLPDCYLHLQLDHPK